MNGSNTDRKRKRGPDGIIEGDYVTSSGRFVFSQKSAMPFGTDALDRESRTGNHKKRKVSENVSILIGTQSRRRSGNKAIIENDDEEEENSIQNQITSKVDDTSAKVPISLSCLKLLQKKGIGILDLLSQDLLVIINFYIRSLAMLYSRIKENESWGHLLTEHQDIFSKKSKKSKKDNLVDVAVESTEKYPLDEEYKAIVRLYETSVNSDFQCLKR